MPKPKKPKGLDKVPEDETFFDYAYRTFQTKFVQALPMGAIRELPSTYMFFFGTFAYIFSLSCFVYFVVTGYNAALASKFVSISNDAGKCFHVLRPVIGTFTADNRYWDSKPDYDPSFGRYVLELNEYEDQLQGYKLTMTKVGQELLDLGNRAKNLSLAQNILLWTTWQTTLDYSKSVNIFYMTGDPKIIYDRELNLGLFASISGDCLVPASASFVESLGKFSLITSASAFKADPICNQSASPEIFLYDEYYDNDDFEVDLDSRSASIAAAVNTGIISIDLLQIITDTSRNYTINGTNVQFTQRFSKRYGGMSPILCFEFPSKNFCLLRIGLALGYPIFLHFGTDLDYPDPCDCDQGDQDTYPYCGVFDFMVGFLFYNLPGGEESTSSGLSKNWMALLTLMTISDTSLLNDQAYNATYAAAMYDEPISAFFQTPEWREKAYAFCTLEGVGSCSILLYNAFDSVTQTVSANNFQLVDGACRDSFSNPNWDNFIEVPPTALVQDYFECSERPTSAFWNSIGIAVGNQSLFVPVILYLTLPMVYLMMNFSGTVRKKEEYSEEEVNAATKALALVMLRIRDGKVRGIKPDGLLKKLTDELIRSSKVESGYPDSDDDDEDEEEESQNKGTGSKRKSTKKRKTGPLTITPTDVFVTSSAEDISPQHSSWSSWWSPNTPLAADSPMHGNKDVEMK